MELLIKRIWDAVQKFENNPKMADVKKLKGKTNEYRLRVGEWRVRFRADFVNKIYMITYVKHRRDIYK